MTRPKYCRKIDCTPGVTYFKPKGIPVSMLEEVTLTLDEFEAVRLGDLDGLYQSQAAVRMNVSRQTFGRIMDSAHRKIADALIHGKALRIEGGTVEIAGLKIVRCEKCKRFFGQTADLDGMFECPGCKNSKYQ
jgi:uncharacterized protein